MYSPVSVCNKIQKYYLTCSIVNHSKSRIWASDLNILIFGPGQLNSIGFLGSLRGIYSTSLGKAECMATTCVHTTLGLICMDRAIRTMGLEVGRPAQACQLINQRLMSSHLLFPGHQHNYITDQPISYIFPEGPLEPIKVSISSPLPSLQLKEGVNIEGIHRDLDAYHNNNHCLKM